MLTGDTTEGVSKTEGATESASCDDESGEKVWTVTAYTEQGITCKEFKDGVGTLLWQIDFKIRQITTRLWITSITKKKRIY